MLEPISGKYIHLEIQGIEYRVYFEESGKGIPLLCQHTAGAEGLQYRQILNDPDVTSIYQVFAIDLPYHGKSLPPENVEWWKEDYRLTKSFLIDCYIKFIEALELDKPVFVGSSMGGHFALDLALERPDDFRALIGVEAAEFTPGFHMDWWIHPKIGSQFKYANLYEATAPYSPEKYRREVAWGYSKNAPSVFNGDLYYYSVEHDTRGKLGQIDTNRVPLYILCGEYDIATSPEMGKEAADQIKGAKFIEMKKLGHFPFTENYEMFKEYLMPILKEIAQMQDAE